MTLCHLLARGIGKLFIILLLLVLFSISFMPKSRTRFGMLKAPLFETVSGPQVENTTEEDFFKDEKIIIDWTGYFYEGIFDGVDKPVNDKEIVRYWNLASSYWCPNLNTSCIFTGDRNLSSEASAILFHVRPQGSWRPNLVPDERFPWQRYIMHIKESPEYTYLDMKNTDYLFNWTMTYRWDSDIPFVFGYVERRTGEPELNDNELLKFVQTKNKTAAWFVSNCGTPSKRELYVKELQKYIDIDIYGGCGPLNCPRGGDAFRTPEAKCFDMLKTDYFFYLSFENSICDDWVTEKFYAHFENHVIPIVLRGSDYNKTDPDGNPVAPPNSYIAADSFDGPESLAEYLSFLMNNTDEYMKYFEWRKEWKVTSLYWLPYKVFCDLCHKLFLDEEPKTWTGLHDWWWGANNEKCEADFAKHLTHKSNRTLISYIT